MLPSHLVNMAYATHGRYAAEEAIPKGKPQLDEMEMPNRVNQRYNAAVI